MFSIAVLGHAKAIARGERSGAAQARPQQLVRFCTMFSRKAPRHDIAARARACRLRLATALEFRGRKNRLPQLQDGHGCEHSGGDCGEQGRSDEQARHVVRSSQPGGSRLLRGRRQEDCVQMNVCTCRSSAGSQHAGRGTSIAIAARSLRAVCSSRTAAYRRRDPARNPRRREGFSLELCFRRR